MSEKKDMDELELAVQALDYAWEAFSSFSKDLSKAKVDMRIVTKDTTALIDLAAKLRKKTQRAIEVAKALRIEQEGQTH